MMPPIVEELKARILRELPPEDREVAERALKHIEENLLGETISLLRAIPFVGSHVAAAVGWLCLRAYQDGWKAHERAARVEATIKRGIGAGKRPHARSPSTGRAP